MHEVRVCISAFADHLLVRHRAATAATSPCKCKRMFSPRALVMMWQGCLHLHWALILNLKRRKEKETKLKRPQDSQARLDRAERCGGPGQYMCITACASALSALAFALACTICILYYAIVLLLHMLALHHVYHAHTGRRRRSPSSVVAASMLDKPCIRVLSK